MEAFPYNYCLFKYLIIRRLSFIQESGRPDKRPHRLVRSFCFMKFTVYILFSESTLKYYSGHTQDLVNRLTEHNSGETISIKNGIPWRVMWTSELSSRAEAMILEMKIKKRGAKRFIQDLSRGA